MSTEALKKIKVLGHNKASWAEFVEQPYDTVDKNFGGTKMPRPKLLKLYYNLSSHESKKKFGNMSCALNSNDFHKTGFLCDLNDPKFKKEKEIIMRKTGKNIDKN